MSYLKSIVVIIILLMVGYFAYQFNSATLETAYSGPEMVGRTPRIDSLYAQLKGETLLHSTHFRNAEKRRITDDPEKAGFYNFRLSHNYKKVGEHITAMKYLNKAVELNPDDFLGYRAWSYLYFYHDFEKAIVDIDNLISLKNDCMTLTWGEPSLYNKGLALYQLQKYDESLEVFEEFKKCEESRNLSVKDNERFHFYKGRCYYELGNFTEALIQYNNIFRDGKYFSSEYIFHKGMTYDQLGNKSKACLLLKEAQTELRKNNKFNDKYIELFDELHEFELQEGMTSCGCD